MGIETIAFAALTAMSAISKISAGKQQAKAAIQEGNINAANKAKETRYKAARQTLSFLNSGLTLEGTPSSVVDDTYATGIADTNQIISNANSKSKNIIAQSRSEAISTIASSFAGAGMGSSMSGSMGSMFSTAGSYLPESFAYSANNAGFGNSAYDMLSMKDARG